MFVIVYYIFFFVNIARTYKYEVESSKYFSKDVINHILFFHYLFQKSKNVHQDFLLFPRALHIGGVRGYYGGFSQLWEGKKWKTDVFFFKN